jgi:fructosamine-3-kinase
MNASIKADNDLLEVKKLLNILENHGNVIVPSLNGKETLASQRLGYFVDRLKQRGMTMQDISNEVNKLNQAVKA